MQSPRASAPDTASAPPPDEEGRALARAERLLACYQQALGHDLPNKLVALQGLARLACEDLRPKADAESLETLMVEYRPLPGSILGELTANFDIRLGRTARELGDGTIGGIGKAGA